MISAQITLILYFPHLQYNMTNNTQITTVKNATDLILHPESIATNATQSETIFWYVTKHKRTCYTLSHKMLNARILMDMIITKLIIHRVKNIDNHKHRITQD